MGHHSIIYRASQKNKVLSFHWNRFRCFCRQSFASFFWSLNIFFSRKKKERAYNVVVRGGNIDDNKIRTKVTFSAIVSAKATKWMFMRVSVAKERLSSWNETFYSQPLTLCLCFVSIKQGETERGIEDNERKQSRKKNYVAYHANDRMRECGKAKMARGVSIWSQNVRIRCDCKTAIIYESNVIRWIKVQSIKVKKLKLNDEFNRLQIVWNVCVFVFMVVFF